MSLRQSVKKSLMDYQDARVRRRELLGPDALDTLSDISSATVDATKEKVKSVAVNLRDKFNEYKDERVKPFIEGIRSRIADIRDNLRESADAVKLRFVRMLMRLSFVPIVPNKVLWKRCEGELIPSEVKWPTT